MKVNFKDTLAKTKEQLEKELAGLHDEIHELRQKAHTQELKTFHKISHARKEIARIMTALSTKQ